MREVNVEMVGVECAEGLPVTLGVAWSGYGIVGGKLVVVAENQGGYDATLVDAEQLYAWLHENLPKYREPGPDLPHPWHPMKTAPTDGTAVLALLDGSDIPYPVRVLNDGWEMVWDGYPIRPARQLRCWMHIPDEPKEPSC